MFLLFQCSKIEIKIGEIPNYIVIKVKDYGNGISKENIEKIYGGKLICNEY